MKLAFVVDPLDGLKPKKDSSIAMMREASRRGHEVYALEACATCFVQDGSVRRARALRLRSTPTTTPGTARRSAEEVPLAFFDLVMMRKDPPFDQEYYYATLLLERAEAEGARVVNSPAGAARLEREARHPALPAVHAADASSRAIPRASRPSSTGTPT